MWIFRFLIYIIFLASFARACFADEAKIKGNLLFQSALGVIPSNNNPTSDRFSRYNKNFAFNTNAEIRAAISRMVDSGVEFGAILQLSTSTYQANTSGSGSYLYYESEYGRIEAGSGSRSIQLMSVSAYSIAGPQRYDDLKYLLILGNGKNDNIINNYYNNLSDYSIIYRGLFTSRGENIRSISYFSPKFFGFQTGLSFAPDSSNLGSHDINSTKNDNVQIISLSDGSSYHIGVKNIINYGLTYETDITLDSALKFGLGFEMGDSLAHKISGPNSYDYKFNKYNIYNLGIIYTYGNYSFAASYADAGKSFSTIDLEKQFNKIENKLFTLGASYDQGPIGLGITYLKNKKFNGHFDALTISGRYKIKQGLLLYLEATPYYYKLNNNNYATNGGNFSKSGSVLICGCRVYF